VSSMHKWTDPFTRVIYQWRDEWQTVVRQGLAKRLEARLATCNSVQHKADTAARFWKEYYEWVFTLRFGKQTGTIYSYSCGAPLYHHLLGISGTTEAIELTEKHFRTTFLDGLRIPPLLPAETDPASTDLGSQGPASRPAQLGVPSASLLHRV